MRQFITRVGRYVIALLVVGALGFGSRVALAEARAGNTTKCSTVLPWNSWCTTESACNESCIAIGDPFAEGACQYDSFGQHCCRCLY